jgi:6-phosphogluconolactonase (cycloisomerase 2 family)
MELIVKVLKSRQAVGMNRVNLMLVLAAAVISLTGCGEDNSNGPVQNAGTMFIYTSNSGPASNSISTFQVTPTSGVLVPLGMPIAAGTTPQQVVLDTSGQFEMVANAGSANLSSYQIGSTGTLSLLATTPVGTNPQPATIDPLDRFLFVPNFGSANLSVFTFNSTTGALAAVAGSPFATGTNPESATVDPQGRFVWINNVADGNISMFFINPVGVPFLTPAPLSPLPTGTTPQRVTFLTLPNTKLIAYIANAGDGTISAFEVNQTNSGFILPAVLGSPYTTGTTPSAVTINPLGTLAFVANAITNDVSVYTIDQATGALTVVQNPGPPPSNSFPAGTNPNAVTLNPAGTFAFVANATSANVSVYAVNQLTGVLTQVAGSPFLTGGIQAQRVTLDPTGQFAFVSNLGSDSIAVFSINQVTGVLTPAAGSPFAAGDQPLQPAVVIR